MSRKDFVDRRSQRMGRRGFLRAAGAGTVASVAGASVLSSCVFDSEDGGTASTIDSQDSESVVSDTLLPVGATDEAVPATDASLPTISWDLPSSWVESLPTLWESNLLFGQRVSQLTGGRFTITARPAGEVAGPLEVLDQVMARSFPAGTTASVYYFASSPVTAFGTAVPFGLTTRQQYAWLYAGGGLELLQEHYARKFNVIQFPMGSTGAQMGGWFNREINSLDDLRGLKMRIPGLGGQVMSMLGVETQTIGVGDIAAALTEGTIDAAEFIGPDDDKNLGLQDAAPYYYYPGFWEPSSFGEIQINLDDWNELPTQYQEAIRSAASETTTRTLALYDARNGQSLNDLVASGTELRLFPDDVLDAARAASGLLLDEIAAGDPDFALVLAHWRDFRRQVGPWFSLAEAAVIR